MPTQEEIAKERGYQNLAGEAEKESIEAAEAKEKAMQRLRDLEAKEQRFQQAQQQRTPSVGRIVHYLHEGIICPAIVTKVYSAQTVALRIFWPPELNHQSESCIDSVPFAEKPPIQDGYGAWTVGHHHCWRWPEITPPTSQSHTHAIQPSEPGPHAHPTP